MYPSLPAARSTTTARDEAARRDPPRFVTFVARHAATLQAFVTSHLIEHGDGAVTAEAFLGMSRARLAEHDAETHASWLFGVCVNLAREFARTTARRLGDGDGMATLGTADQLRVAHRVSTRLSMLGDDLHDALLLAATGEMSIDDAALLPSLPATLVRSRVDRGLRALDRRLHPAQRIAA